jgi:hypothetical protein
MWLKELTLEGKNNIVFKLDTGAQVNILPLNIFKQLKIIQRDLNSIDEWGTCNDMKINIAKCNKISFSGLKTPFCLIIKSITFP